MNAEFVEQHWPLTDVSLGEVLKESEKGRTVVRFSSNEGQFVYRIADSSKKSDSLDKELHAFEFLPSHGFYAIPRLVKTKNEELYQSAADRHVYVLEYIEGSEPPITSDTYCTLGRLTAQLHNVQGYPHVSEFDADYIAEHHLPDRAQGIPFKEAYFKLAHALPKFNGLPKTLIHSDVGPFNSVQKANGDIVFIDWDDVGIGPTVLDLGYVSIFQQFMVGDGSFSFEHLKAFFNGYYAVRALADIEKQHIFDAGLFIALDYIVFGNTEHRWQGIQWALENRNQIEKIFKV